MLLARDVVVVVEDLGVLDMRVDEEKMEDVRVDVHLLCPSLRLLLMLSE